MEVPFLDLKTQYHQIKTEVMDAIIQVCDNQNCILGIEVTELEDRFSRYVNSKHAIGCASGSDALLLALMAVGIGNGDEVITTPYTFFATASSIVRLGGVPVFVDIDPKTYNINTSLIEEKISDKTKAIMPVHLFGQCADMDMVMEIASRHDIAVIEDAAQAIGAKYKGRNAGSMARMGCFSFYPTKNLGCFGDGGMITCDDKELTDKIRMLGQHGANQKYFHSIVGLNSRLDTIQAAILLVKLRYLDKWTEARRNNAKRYGELFSKYELMDQCILPVETEYNYHVFNNFIIRIKDRNGLRDYLKENGIGTGIYYPLSLHEQKCFAYLGYSRSNFPESEKAADETLALPIYPELSEGFQEYVVSKIREYFR